MQAYGLDLSSYEEVKERASEIYARLEDEYELLERTETLTRKLSVIADTAEVLTDIIDTRRSLRLEIIIVALIAIELLVAGYQAGYQALH